MQQYYQTVQGNPIVMVKGECTVEASMQEVVDFLSPNNDEEFVGAMEIIDTMFSGGRIVKKLDSQHQIYYATFKV